MTITRPNNGADDLSSGSFASVNSAVWKSGLTGIWLCDAASLPGLGNVVISGFFNGISVERSSSLWANNVTITFYGGNGIAAYSSSALYATTVSVTNGSNSASSPGGVLASYTAVVYVKNANISSTYSGAVSQSQADLELVDTTIRNATVGVIGTNHGYVNLSTVSIVSTSEAVQSFKNSTVNGNTVTINTSNRPVHAEHMGQVYLSDTLSRISNSGASYIAPDDSGNGYRWIGGSAYVD